MQSSPDSLVRAKIMRTSCCIVGRCAHRRCDDELVDLALMKLGEVLLSFLSAHPYDRSFPPHQTYFSCLAVAYNINEFAGFLWLTRYRSRFVAR